MIMPAPRASACSARSRCVSIVLAAATIWLFLTNPVTVANAVNEGEISPLVRDLAQVLFDALRGTAEILCKSTASGRSLAVQFDALEFSRFDYTPVSAFLQEPRQDPAVDELERRLAACCSGRRAAPRPRAGCRARGTRAPDPRTDRPGTSGRSARRRAASARSRRRSRYQRGLIGFHSVAQQVELDVAVQPFAHVLASTARATRRRRSTARCD